jgi:hypothetical protein
MYQGRIASLAACVVTPFVYAHIGGVIVQISADADQESTQGKCCKNNSNCQQENESE